MNTDRPFHFHASATLACNSSAVRVAKVRRTGVGMRLRGVAVAGGIGRANRDAIGRPVGDDSRHGIAATVVLAEHLTEKAPDGRDRVEHAVAILDAMFVEDVQDVGFGQNIRKGESLVARETSADRIQAGHGIVFPIMGRDVPMFRGKHLGTRERPGDERQSQEPTPKWPLLWYRCGQVGRKWHVELDRGEEYSGDLRHFARQACELRQCSP